MPIGSRFHDLRLWLASSRVARAIAQRYRIHAPRSLASALAKIDRLLSMSR
jgi:hypothetical protein